MMFGPEDFYLRATTTIQKFINRKIPFIPAGGASFVDVRDVATAFRHAMVIGRPGS
jgi:dihydroflavonol-4-reductase